MNAPTEDLAPYTHLWQGPAYPPRWVIWHTAADVMVFDRDINCPVHIDDETTLCEVLRRMRAAGVEESEEYPGRPCA